MTDAEIIEAMARAYRNTYYDRQCSAAESADCDDGDCACSLAAMTAAHAICAPAVRERCAEAIDMEAAALALSDTAWAKAKSQGAQAAAKVARALPLAGLPADKFVDDGLALARARLAGLPAATAERTRAAFGERPQGPPPGPKDPPLGSNNVKHHYKPSRYGFCRECGYPASELLMHFAKEPAPAAPAESDDSFSECSEKYLRRAAPAESKGEKADD